MFSLIYFEDVEFNVFLQFYINQGHYVVHGPI